LAGVITTLVVGVAVVLLGRGALVNPTAVAPTTTTVEQAGGQADDVVAPTTTVERVELILEHAPDGSVLPQDRVSQEPELIWLRQDDGSYDRLAGPDVNTSPSVLDVAIEQLGREDCKDAEGICAGDGVAFPAGQGDVIAEPADATLDERQLDLEDDASANTAIEASDFDGFYAWQDPGSTGTVQMIDTTTVGPPAELFTELDPS
ncbi:MAG: hypothetical protein GY901_00670, partial [Actinomycetia bacterium]|nr:hypothetical protein [Actinomycetes bacterium]